MNIHNIRQKSKLLIIVANLTSEPVTLNDIRVYIIVIIHMYYYCDVIHRIY